MKGLDSIMERNPAIKKAHRLYEIFTADKELMEKYEARQKYLRDVSTIKGVSHDEGFAQGREEGREETQNQVVLSMHQKGFELPTIAEITGLTIEQIHAILSIEN